LTFSVGQKVELERRTRTDEFGRLLPNFSAPNSIYNQRLETYYFQSAAARSRKTLAPIARVDAPNKVNLKTNILASNSGNLTFNE